ncbi:MAG: ABC transporter permease [Planctomycetes bacterium]|nr:ABC transporter permease [Planctomycetota bacterium]
MTESTAAIAIDGLTVRVAGRMLLDDASLRVEPGEVVLLVGLSGSGKSITLKLLGGLLDDESFPIQVDGSICIFGEDVKSASRRSTGIVFQDFGLFDELSVRDNVLFGRDHGSARSPTMVDDLLRELDLPPNARVASLSGGMKQRVAIARTLAFDPGLVLYDEPTSGLDPALARQVADRIRSTNDEHGKTSFVVTHDLEALAEVADRIYLLDVKEKCFRQVERTAVDEALQTLRRTAPPQRDQVATQAGRLERLKRRGRRFFETTGKCLEASFGALGAVVPRWPRLSWGLRYLVYYLRLTALGSALVYVAICGFILGLIVTWFTFSFLPFKEYTEPLLIDKVISAIGFALYRIMVPGMVAMLVAARSGAALSADVGNRVWSHQIDAIRSFGVKPQRYLFSNILIASLVGMPLLVAVNFLAARLASLLVFLVIHPEESTWFWDTEFDRFLDGGGQTYKGTAWLAGKTLLAAAGTATIAWYQGLRPKGSGRDVAIAVTRTIIWATLFVLIVQLAAALIEFEPL